MLQLPEIPFFIVGHPRSGTTLLRFMLSSHPRLYIPEETGFIPFLIKEKQVTTLLSQRQVSEILKRIGKLNYLWRDKITDIPAFYATLPEPRLNHMLDRLFRQHTADHDVTRWGDKTPLYIRYIPLLNKIFPQSQFIHVIRDGRDATLSARKKWPHNATYMDIYYLLKNWIKNVDAGRSAGKWLGDARYLEIKYETLVEQPRVTIESVCAFLNEAFHPAMMDHTALARRVGPGPDGHIEVLKPITSGSVGRWKVEMTIFEKKLSDQIAGDMLADLGYELANLGPLTAGEHMQYATLASKFTLSNMLRSLLYATGILTLNRSMRRRQ